MSNDLEQFKGTYITECFELLEDMEERLLNLSEGAVDIEELNAIFRCAHSIKGGGGAFGFTELVHFTHVLEALLDAMREGKVEVTKDGVDALLKSVDVVKHMVEAARDGNAVQPGYGDELKHVLEGLAGGVSGSAKQVTKASAKNQEAKSEVKPKKNNEFQFFDIGFKPDHTLFTSGNEPLLLIRELKRAGDVSVKVFADDVPDFKDLDPKNCYLRWNFEVNTEKGVDFIKEVFEFVVDNCDLRIDEMGGIMLPPSAIVEADIPQAQQVKVPENISTTAGPVQAAKVDTPAKDDKAKVAAVTSIRVDIDKVDRLVNMVGEIVITQAMIEMQARDLPSDKFARLIQGVSELSQHTRELQESVMSVRMQPVKSVFSRMPRIVRDLSTQLGKNITIEMEGENTEIDKTVIEQLSDPLTHMIRNSVDHGIEKPDVRKQAGKPEKGTIKLSASHSGGRILIEVADDGAGINRERVFKKAIEKGILAADAKLSDEEIDNLVFHAGFSTAEKVTNVSGRGVGMDVVRRNIESLGGTIDLISNPGKGMRITVSLPLTLAIMDGMIIRVGKEHYIIPINNIIESLRPKKSEVKQVADGGFVINVRGNFVPIIFLHELFDINGAIKDPSEGLVVLVENGKDRLGVVVDELVGQQQVVIKNIEENTNPIEGIGGATILGDGSVSLILDIAKLQKLVTLKGDKNGKAKEQKKVA